MSKKLSLRLLLLITALFSSFLIGVFIGRATGESNVKLSHYEQAAQDVAITETTNITEATTETTTVAEMTETYAETEPEAEPSVAPETNASSDSRGKININNASAEDLMLLPGIGEVLAQRILDYRDENGSFGSISELINIRGIGEKTLNKISDYITVGG